jgi:hypothetical protein
LLKKLCTDVPSISRLELDMTSKVTVKENRGLYPERIQKNLSEEIGLLSVDSSLGSIKID